MTSEKPQISEHEAEELLKGMGRVAAIVVHETGLVTATAISANPSDARILNEVDELLRDIQRKYRIVRKVGRYWLFFPSSVQMRPAGRVDALRVPWPEATATRP